MKTRQILLAVACIVVIVGCTVWTWRTQFAAPKFNVALHRGLGRVLAEETARLLTNSGKVVLITLEPGMFPELKVQLSEFEKTLAQHRGLSTKTYHLETDDKPKYGFGSGLSARRYVRIVNKNESADAFVSFVGAPDPAAKEMQELKRIPNFIAECRSANNLKGLFAQKAIQVAVVGRFQYPTPFKGTPRTPGDWVEQRFQIVTAEKAASLPADTSE